MAEVKWPLVVAGLLGLTALLNVTLQTDAPTSVGMLLALAVTLPVALAHSHMVAAALLIELGTLLTLLARLPLPIEGWVALAVIFLLIGLHASRRTAFLLLAPFTVLFLFPVHIGLLVIVAIAASIGMVRQVRVETAKRDASQQEMADSLLEHVARGERARIARELHDVVAHHISMVAVQAEAARLTTAGMPAEGAQRLVAIGDTARMALTEMRRLLGVLREDAGAEADRQPQPGLHQLIDLIDEARALDRGSMRLIVRGRVGPLDPGIELTAYRIVQEALTNARRHAPGAGVDVELDYREAALHVRIRDNGPGPVTDSAGHGLTGMQERTAMAGGSLSTGSGVLGGFLVEAVLPR